MARESSTIAPPSGLQVNRQSSVPVHVQLTTQIRHLIEAGQLKPGMQLPTVRTARGVSCGSIGTRAARALADLLRDGYLEEPAGARHLRGGSAAHARGRVARSLEVLVEETLERARQLGFTHEELLVDGGRACAACQQRIPAPPASARSSWSATGKSSRAIARSSRRPARLGGPRPRRGAAGRAWPRSQAFLTGYRVVVTTFFHIHEVKAAIPADGRPVVALLSEANISTLLRLTELPPGATVGLVLHHRRRQPEPAPLATVRRPLAHHARCSPPPTIPWSLSRMLEITRVVLCSEQGAARIRKTLPPDVELIVPDRTPTAAASSCCGTC